MSGAAGKPGVSAQWTGRLEATAPDPWGASPRLVIAALHLGHELAKFSGKLVEVTVRVLDEEESAASG